MRASNVNEISERFRPDYVVQEPIQPVPGFTPEGTLQALAACGKHFGHYDTAAIWVGDLPCPNGCPTPAWAKAS